MNRCKWFKVSLGDLTYLKFANALKDFAYSEKKSYGFVLDEVRKTSIRARYITKKSIRNVVKTPFGEELIQELTSYDTTDFRLISSGPGLELYNVPRSTSEFFNQLAMASDFRLTIENYETDVKKWARSLNAKSSNRLQVVAIECIDIILNGTAKACLTISGTKDIESHMEGILGGKKFVLKSIKANFDGKLIVLNSGASASTSERNYLDIFDVLRESIPS